jgi:hypothetical protein
MEYKAINSFDEAVAQYAKTRPLVSKRHTLQDDVRPIWARKRKFERIKKIDDNTYALLDGTYGGTMWATGNNQQASDEHEYENTMAPIVWMRREDGDYIRIRNYKKANGGLQRYNFLYEYTPDRMRMIRNNGKLSFQVPTEHGRVDFPLPKCNVVYDHQTGKLLSDDNTFLMFRVNVDGTYTRVGTLLCPTARIDKELKQSLKPHIAGFYEFCAAVTPMLDMSWSTLREYKAQLTDRALAPIPAELVRGIVVQEDHELRVALAAFVVSRCVRRRPIRCEGDLQNIKASFNRAMNTLLGLYTTEAK